MFDYKVERQLTGKVTTRNGTVKKKRRDIETEEQADVIRWAKKTKLAGYNMGEYLTHVPNEGKRGRTAQADFKRLGGRRGYPDLILDLPASDYHGLRIEMKPPKGYRSVLSDSQQIVINRLNKVGILSVVCYGAQEAKNMIVSYMTGDLAE
ncbi:VRR-NUC domain-containing protein [Vibrio breoganii]|uniref:VRR-NUC domain-containing protein n=1 Tax=Vibrio breoganii TaxID=553239 RepID=A0AAP8MX95_9VIBR|nr:VRR-NUC domain-containing protein [Vibrio breoganii]PMP10236.1 hypothetical protein BCS93_11210 [Vibrio breoganii]